ncbi:MAG: sodium:proton antiporter [Aquabacterium sp.]|nr:MAG: sodium:proton antiporter [Aquabacterium sp.]
MTLAMWALFGGVLLLSFVLLGTWLGRLPLSSAMLYLGVGWLLGPSAVGVLNPDPVRHAHLLEVACEAALIISLFAVGLHLGVPFRDRRWWLPLRLAFVSMAAMVLMIAAVGFWLLDLPPGAAVLLGAILAPTDPVLASGVQSEAGDRPDLVGFSLAGEGGLNDGAAFPFVMLGLGMLGMHGADPWLAHWLGVELLWATAAGLAIGGAVGGLVGWLVVRLRAHHREALGLDVFLGLGLIGLAYGAAQAAQASGFLAVFAAGFALRRVREQPIGEAAPQRSRKQEARALHSRHASAAMRESVQLFNGQLEKLAELAMVLLVGAMLVHASNAAAAWWFVPLVLVVLRPLSTLPAIMGRPVRGPQAAMVAWFGIRGIGSIYYMAFAVRHGLDPVVAEVVVSLTLWTVAASILAHGLSARPMMRWYLSSRVRR